jgi:hypothetical protein
MRTAGAAGAAAIETENRFLFLASEESTTLIVNLKLPVVTGVPETVPVFAFKDNPVGRDPDLTEN